MPTIQPDEVQDWVQNELLAPERERPIVAITSDFRTKEFFMDPEELVTRISDLAEVVVIPTGEGTWALSEALPPKLDVYGGAMRIWWPGLTRESSPYDHKLYLATSRDEAIAAVERIDRALRERSGASTTPGSEPIGPPVAVDVTRIEPTIEVADAEGRTGRITEADVPLHALSICLREGMRLDAVRLDRDEDRVEGLRFSLIGQVPSPWEQIGRHLKPGDLAFGRIVAIQDRWTLVELLPGARGIVGIAEVDHSFVESISDYVEIDEIVKVRILSIDPDARRAVLSLKEALAAKDDPSPSPSLVPDGEPFDWYAFLGESLSAGEIDDEADGDQETKIGSLRRELRAANDERTLLRDTVARLRRDLRDLDERFQDLERRTSGELHPLKDARHFLRAVRVAYARAIEEDERLDYPLRPMRVGSVFLERAGQLEGVALEKVIEVAALVACGKASSIEGRDVQAIGDEGPASDDDARVRELDGARAWGCALQMGESSAPRLQWWVVPDDDDGRVEFASVGPCDEFDVPE